MLLLACGGQGTARLEPNAQGQNGAPTTVLTGAYGPAQTNSGGDFVSFAWVDRQVPATPVGLWMALYMPPLTDPTSFPPVLYLGRVTLQTQGAASVDMTWFYKINQLRNGSAAITAASADGYKMSLQGVNSTGSPSALQFDATTLATSSNIDLDWTGTWADAGPGGSIKTNASLSIRSGSANTDFGNCNVALSLVKDGVDKPYFLTTATLRSAANKVCERSPSANSSVTLSGVAFIHDSVVGSASVKRLEIMLTDPSGSGVTFRGELP